MQASSTEKEQLERELEPLSSLKKLDPDLASILLSSRRTGLSFQRTRMSADRTLMSIVRTSLALISFGFTIFQFLFRYLQQEAARAGGEPSKGARNLGLALVVLGLGMLVLGIWDHARFMLQLRRDRSELVDHKIIASKERFPVSTTLVTALALLLIGAVALGSMLQR